MKKIILAGLLSVLAVGASAEVVKDSKGKSIQLNSDKTWEYVSSLKNKKNPDRVLSKNEKFTAIVENGNKEPVEIQVLTKFDDASTQKVTEKEVMKWIEFTMFKTTLKLKNKYSFVPKSAFVQLNNNKLKILIEYTAKNSYGADMVGHESEELILNDKGEYTIEKLNK